MIFFKKTVQKKLLFLHIPKAGGSTLQDIIDRCYPSKAVLKLAPASSVTVAEFRKMTPAQKDRFQIICGHFCYGLHQDITGPFSYLTMLRAPVDRVISHYYYVIRTPVHRLHKKVTEAKMTLSDYVSSGINTELDNGQVRLLSGTGHDVPFGGCNPQMLEQAKENLRGFAAIGLMERFDESLARMRTTFGWRDLKYEPVNVTPNRPRSNQVEKPVLDLIESHNRLDLELYRFAETLFEKPPQ